MALQSSVWLKFFAIWLGLCFALGSGAKPIADDYDLPEPGRPLPGDCDERLLNPTMVLTRRWQNVMGKAAPVYEERSTRNKQTNATLFREITVPIDGFVSGKQEGDWIRLSHKKGYCLITEGGKRNHFEEQPAAKLVEAAWTTISSTRSCSDTTSSNRLAEGGGYFTLQTCKAFCLDTPGCTAIDYFAKTFTCTLYKQPCLSDLSDIRSVLNIGGAHYKYEVNGGLPKVKDCWVQYLRCLRSIIISGRELDKSMKIASWKNNRYRQAFESVIAYWGYMAGLPDDGKKPMSFKDNPLDNLVSNSEHDQMTALHSSTKKVGQLFKEFDFYAGVKPRGKKEKWQHLEIKQPKEKKTVRFRGKKRREGEHREELLDCEDEDNWIVNDWGEWDEEAGCNCEEDWDEEHCVKEEEVLGDGRDAKKNRDQLISREPISRNFSDFFWHPKPNQYTVEHDDERKPIAHGDQIPKMIPDSRLDGHGYNPTMVYEEMHTHDPGNESLNQRRKNILGNQGNAEELEDEVKAELNRKLQAMK